MSPSGYYSGRFTVVVAAQAVFDCGGAAVFKSLQSSDINAQSPTDNASCILLFNINTTVAVKLETLPAFQCLLAIGSNPGINGPNGLK